MLTKLRQATGEHIVATRSEIALNPQLPRQVDVEIFSRAAAQWRNGTDTEPSAIDLAVLAKTFALYQGDFLAGLEIPHAPAFEEWMLLERERLRQLALELGTILARQYEITGEAAAAIAICRRLLSIDPWQETVYRLLMRLLVQRGQRISALQQYERCRQILADDLAVEPEAATTALYEQIRHDAVADPATVPVDKSRRSAPTATTALAQIRTVLPPQTTPFLGRHTELQQLFKLLADPACRLLTLMGPGGIGKTRLAQQLAHQLVTTPYLEAAAPPDPVLSGRFADGIFYVSATSLPTVDDLLHAVANLIGFTFSGYETAETQLLNQLRTRHMLLVIDNFEHLVGDATRLTHWLQIAPQLSLMITSRERLNLSDEWLFPVQGLPLPPVWSDAERGWESVEQNDAVQLFVRRAQRVNLGFAPAVEGESVVAICRLLTGMPLAIELAASWTRTHSCSEILAEIRQNFDFLATSLRDIPERHRSLRAAFDHSWRLLERADAAIIRRLVLLPAGFSAPLARHVAQATPVALLRLVDKSFLQRSPGQRYIIHELLRQYVAQQLMPTEQHATHYACARYFGHWSAQLHQQRESVEELAALTAVGVELENLRTIWQWALGQLTATPSPQDIEQQVELLNALLAILPMLAYFYIRRSRYSEGKQFFIAAIAVVEAARWPQKEQTRHNMLTVTRQLFWIHATVALADLCFNLSEFANVVTMIQSVLPRLAQQGNTLWRAEALTILGKSYIRMGQYADAEQALQTSLALFQRSKARKERSAVLNALGILYSNQRSICPRRGPTMKNIWQSREFGYQRNCQCPKQSRLQLRT
ncbi:MAG: BTAD domain-containing putative transcriptional regulator [Caldilineaceae bacterium]